MNTRMAGTFTTNTKMIMCPGCKKDVLIHVASFYGIGKKCPYCLRVIFYDHYYNKIKAVWRSR